MAHQLPSNRYGRSRVATGVRRTLVALAVVALLPASALAQMTEIQLAKRSATASWLKRFRGSAAVLATYVGSGTFVRNRYSDDPYVVQELGLLPRFNLSKAQSLRLMWLGECEYTDPDRPSAGRHCTPSDLRLSYHHIDLWRDPWVNGRLTASGQVWFPVSYESRFNHTVVNLRAAVGYLARVLSDRLELRYDLAVQKYLPTRKIRGFVHEATDQQGLPLCLSPAGTSGAAACGSGGRMNDSWAVINSLHAAFFFTPKLWLSADMLILNYFRYAVPDDYLGTDGRPTSGRADITVGMLELAYQLQEHLVLAAGTSSMQPALTADAKAPRFPFWDFVSPSNNYSKLYVSASLFY